MPKKKRSRQPAAGMSRGHRGMFLRIPVPSHDKLRRLSAQAIQNGEKGSINSVVIRLIEQAKERA